MAGPIRRRLNARRNARTDREVAARQSGMDLAVQPTLFDRAAGLVSPKWMLSRLENRIRSRIVLQRYEAAVAGRRHRGWTTPSDRSANALIELDSTTVTQKARDLVRNNPYAARAVGAVVGNTIGKGITVLSPVQEINDAWREWGLSEADAEGVCTFNGLMALGTRSVVESGSCLIRFRDRRPSDGLSVPMQLQVLESDHLDRHKTDLGNGRGNFIWQGIEFDRLGRRIAYWLFPEHPGGPMRLGQAPRLQSRRVPASQIIHVFEKLRPGQADGFSWFAPSIVPMRDLDEYEDAELLRKKIEACLVAMVTTPAGAAGSPIAPISDTSDDGRRIESFEPGQVMYGRTGEAIDFHDPKVSGAYPDYVRHRLHAIAAGIGVTYQMMTGDLSQANYSSHRAGLLEFRNVIDMFRTHVLLPMVIKRIHRRFVETAFLSGRITELNTQAECFPPKWQSVDPLKEVQAKLLEVRAGFTTLDEAIAESGEDLERRVDRMAEINSMLDERDIVLDSDARKVSRVGVVQSSDPLALEGTDESSGQARPA